VWKTLGEVAELVRGNGLPKSDFTETGVPAIHYGQIYTYFNTFTNETKSFVSPETAMKLKKVDTGDVVITNTSENIEDVGKSVVYLGKEQAVTGGHATIIKPSKEILGKYFAYFTQSEGFASQKRRLAKGTKVIDVSATDLAKIIIPIPPLAEQERIVSILDTFDTLTTSISEGLPKEIELRKKQYEYYRDSLLCFSTTKNTKNTKN
jgi:type I restriction enzyme S subunit